MRIEKVISFASTILMLAIALIGTNAIAQPVLPFFNCNQNGMYYKADLATDSNNCGVCGVICPVGTPCKAGRCVDSACPSTKRSLINVNQNPSDPKAFHTIQAAVNIARPCDTIYVAPGTYKEHIKIDKSLVIKGSGETLTIVDGSKTGRVFEIGSTNRSITVTLSDIKIQNGLTVNNNGGGILNSATLMASRCNISRNEATEGGGIYNAPGASTLMLSNSTIYENTAGNCGGGIFIWGNATISGVASKLIGNTALTDGGGIYSWGNVTVSGVISKNIVSNGRGGGLFNWGNLTVTSGIISWNEAAYNGGGIFNSRSNSPGALTVKNSTFFGNNASVETTGYGGGGIYNEAKATIDRSSIGTINRVVGKIGNTASYGGGICNTGSAATLAVTRSTISWNKAIVKGGGIYNSYGAGLTCDSKQVVNNNPDNIVKV